MAAFMAASKRMAKDARLKAAQKAESFAHRLYMALPTAMTVRGNIAGYAWIMSASLTRAMIILTEWIRSRFFTLSIPSTDGPMKAIASAESIPPERDQHRHGPILTILWMRSAQDLQRVFHGHNHLAG